MVVPTVPELRYQDNSDTDACLVASERTSAPVFEAQIHSNADIKALRKAVPTHCFESSFSRAFYYLFRDVFLAAFLLHLALSLIPKLEFPVLQWVFWGLYGYLQGLVFTGLWVISHECGHGALFPVQSVNDIVGFAIHSFLLTPYFSWKYTHRRHHMNANNIVKDLHYVPPRRQAYLDSFWYHVDTVDDLVEDAPIMTLFRLLVQQTLGWPLYVLTNITASPGSLARPSSTLFLGNSHFAPFGSLFRREEALYVLLSNIGILFALALLWAASKLTPNGVSLVALAYLQPYLWVNHWIIAITYLHHTDPDVPKYDSGTWTFAKGATATIDRNFGWVGRALMHGIADYHVVHHLFPSIPFYHAKEATEAIIPVLGNAYHARKTESYMHSLWEGFTKCQYVEPDENRGEPGALWYRPGPAPGPEYSMGRKLFSRKHSE